MFSFIYNGQHYANTDAKFLASLGMDEDTIESIQRDAGDYDRQQWHRFDEVRAAKIMAVEWRIHRMYREDQLGLKRTDDDAMIQKIHEYIQALADLPQQFHSVDDIEWPQVP